MHYQNRQEAECSSKLSEKPRQPHPSHSNTSALGTECADTCQQTRVRLAVTAQLIIVAKKVRVAALKISTIETTRPNHAAPFSCTRFQEIRRRPAPDVKCQEVFCRKETVYVNHGLCVKPGVTKGVNRVMLFENAHFIRTMSFVPRTPVNTIAANSIIK